MRRDMKHIIRERGKHYGWKSSKRRDGFKNLHNLSTLKGEQLSNIDDYYDLIDDLYVDDRKKLSMTHDRSRYSGGFNLGPIFRFIETKVGQRWDDIYSEFKRSVPHTEYVDPFKWTVYHNCYIDDYGIPRESDGKPVHSQYTCQWPKNYGSSTYCVIDGILTEITVKQAAQGWKNYFKDKNNSSDRNVETFILYARSGGRRFYDFDNIYLNSFDDLLNLKDSLRRESFVDIVDRVRNEKDIFFYFKFKKNSYKKYKFNPYKYNTSTFVAVELYIADSGLNPAKLTSPYLVYFPVEEVQPALGESLKEKYESQSTPFGHYYTRPTRTKVTEQDIQDALSRPVYSNRKEKRLKLDCSDEV